MRPSSLFAKLSRVASVALLACLVMPVNSQDSKPEYGVLNLSSRLGSYKLLDGEGTVEINFTGTVLVSHLKGSATPSGNVKLEYDANDRKAFFGSGKVVVNGSFRAVQWFGRNMNTKWTGRGIARLHGDFDKDLHTGWYWYDTNAEARKIWKFHGQVIPVPEPKAPQPIERGGTGGGS